jgi:hypothetical protein
MYHEADAAEPGHLANVCGSGERPLRIAGVADEERHPTAGGTYLVLEDPGLVREVTAMNTEDV